MGAGAIELDNECKGGAGNTGVPKMQSIKLEFDVVASIRKGQMMPSDLRGDKGFTANSNSVIPVPLSRKPSGFLFPL